MTPSDDSTRLERRYRRLLLAYPLDYRAERGDEIVSTLMSAAKPGQRKPSFADTVDLVWNGMRNRARASRRTVAAPVTADALRHAGMVMLVVATAVAVGVTISIGVRGAPMFEPGQMPNPAYPAPVRLGLAGVLAGYPLALVAACIGRHQMARWLATAGAIGSTSFAVLVVAYARRTEAERVELGDLAFLTVAMCLPAILLAVSRPVGSAGFKRAPWIAYTALLCAPVVAYNLLEMWAMQWYDDAAAQGSAQGASYTAPPAHPAEFNSGITVGVDWLLITIGGWQLIRALLPRHNPRHLITAWVLTIPALGWAVGSLFSPVDRTWDAEVASNLFVLVAILVGVLVLGAFAMGALRRAPAQRGYCLG